MSLVRALNVATPFTLPSRLREGTHRQAQRGLSGEYGRQMVKADVDLDEQPTNQSHRPDTEQSNVAAALVLRIQSPPSTCRSRRIRSDELSLGSTDRQ